MTIVRTVRPCPLCLFTNPIDSTPLPEGGQLTAGLERGRIRQILILAVALSGLQARQANALIIEVDYTYDSSQFFTASGNPGGATGAAQARAALEAAAARWSAIIDQPLGALDLVDDDLRIRSN